MRILVACEFSGVVRESFAELGHVSWSCDLLPSEIPGNHYQGDVMEILNEGWDLMIAHPPCTYLTCSASWAYMDVVNRNVSPNTLIGKERRTERRKAIMFVNKLLNAPIARICLENPVGYISTKVRPPDQIIQPWQFGHGETKKTCFWLKNLPLLEPTNIVKGRESRVHKMSPSKDRWKERSRTYSGIARAMADQWGNKRKVFFAYS